MLPEKFVDELAAAGDPAGLDQREPFPGLAETGVIIFHALERARERSRLALRPEPQVDAKERAGRIMGGKSLDNFGAELIEPLMIGEVRRDLPFVVVEKDHIDIGAVVQLEAAEFPQSEDSELRVWPAAAAAQFGIPVGVDIAHADFRQGGELLRGLLQRRGFGDFAQCDPKHLSPFPKPERLKFPRKCRALADSLQVGQHCAMTARPGTNFRLREPKENFRMAH